MKLTNIKSQTLRWSSLLLSLLLFGVCAWLTQQYHWVFDWTRDQRNTLTETSRSILQQMELPLHMTVLTRNAASERHRTKHILERYQRYKPDIEVHFLDNETQIVQAKELHLYNSGELRIDYQDRFEIVEQITEGDVTNALQRLSRETKPWVAFLTGHGERDLFNQDNQGYSTLKQTLDSSGMQVQDLNLLETTVIPDNLSVLVIAAPQSTLLSGEEKLLLDYVERGGNLLWLHEPNSLAPLVALSHRLGVTWIAGTIIDANQQLRSILGIKHPAVVPVVEYQAHAITEKLQAQTLYPFAVGFAVDTAADWQVQPLFYSLPRAWSETAPLAGDDAVFDTETGDTAGPLLMAATLSRPRATAATQRIVIIGDSDFMANGYIGHGANLSLSVSVLQWLAHDDQRIALLPYQPPDVSLQLSNVAIVGLTSSYVLLVPLSVLLTGLFIGLRRRKS